MSTTTRWGSAVRGLALGSTLFLGSVYGQAQVPNQDSAAAKALFDQARDLMAEHRYAEACPKFEDSARLDGRSSTLLNLGDCYEKQGRLATARISFLDAARVANQTGNPEREGEARQRAQALAGKIPSLLVRVTATHAVPGLLVKRDGKPMGSGQLGAAIPVDPGNYTLEATAPGYVAWIMKVDIVSNGETTTVEVPSLEPVPTAPITSEPAATKSPVSPRASDIPSPASPVSHGLGTTRTAALVAGGLGVVGIGLGSFFGLSSKAKRDEADTHCSGARCVDQTGADLRSSSMALGWASTVAFAVGVAGLGTGATLWVLGAPPSSSTASASPRPVLRAGLGQVYLEGAW